MTICNCPVTPACFPREWETAHVDCVINICIPMEKARWKNNSNDFQNSKNPQVICSYKIPCLSLSLSRHLPCSTLSFLSDILQTSDECLTMFSSRRIPLSCCHSTHPQTHLPSNQSPFSAATQQRDETRRRQNQYLNHQSRT